MPENYGEESIESLGPPRGRVTKALVSAAAEASETFGDDALEQYAKDHPQPVEVPASLSPHAAGEKEKKRKAQPEAPKPFADEELNRLAADKSMAPATATMKMIERVAEKLKEAFDARVTAAVQELRVEAVSHDHGAELDDYIEVVAERAADRILRSPELAPYTVGGKGGVEALVEATAVAAITRLEAPILKQVEQLFRRHGGTVVPTNDKRYELELAEGVEPIDRLHAARRDAVGRLSVLEGKYEVWDARRKMHRSGIATELAGIMAATEQKDYLEKLKTDPKAKAPKEPSEAELERLAAADPRVVTFLDEAEEWLAELFVTRNEVKEYDEIVNRDQAVLRLRARERDL